MSALMTSRNRPSVATVTGRLRMRAMGFTSTFTIDRNKAVTMGASQPPPTTMMPGTSQAATPTATALASHVPMNFMRPPLVVD